MLGQRLIASEDSKPLSSIINTKRSQESQGWTLHIESTEPPLEASFKQSIEKYSDSWLRNRSLGVRNGLNSEESAMKSVSHLWVAQRWVICGSFCLIVRLFGCLLHWIVGSFTLSFEALSNTLRHSVPLRTSLFVSRFRTLNVILYVFHFKPLESRKV